MPAIADVSAVLLANPQRRWPFVLEPFFAWTDFPWLSGPLEWASNDSLISDPDLQAVYPAPVRIPMNVTMFDDPLWSGSYNSVNRVSLRREGVEDIAFIPSIENTAPIRRGVTAALTLGGGREHTLELDMSYFQGGADAVNCTIAAESKSQKLGLHGVSIYTGWGALASVDEAVDTAFYGFKRPDNQNLPHSADIYIGIGTEDETSTYRIRFTGNGDAEIGRKLYGEADYTLLRKVPLTGVGSTQDFFTGGQYIQTTPPTTWANLAMFFSGTNQHPIDVRLIGGRLKIRLWDTTQEFTFDEARIDKHKKPITTIDWIKCMTKNCFGMSIRISKLAYRQRVTYDSVEIPIGFSSDRINVPFIEPAGQVPPGWNAYADPDVSDLQGPIATYRLVMEGPEDGTFRGEKYSNTVAAVRAVHLTWSSVVANMGTAGLIGYPEQIEVEHTFDPDTLTIQSSGHLTFNNNRPSLKPTGETITWGEWSRIYGQCAIDVGLSRTIPAGYIPAPVQIFAGYGHQYGETTAEAGGGSHFVMGLAGRHISLLSPRFALPWMDGWNIFYAIAFLAQLGGVDISNMAFAQFVPEVPFGEGSDHGSEEGPAYYLPVGAQGSVLTRFSGVPLWAIMQKQAYSIGYMLFFDVFGNLQFRKFKVPLGVKRTFTESDHASADWNTNGGLEGCSFMQARKDHSEVRNQSLIVGIDAFAPRQNPIVVKFQDDDSILNGNAYNFLGYRNPAVWEDSQFANEHFAYQAGLSMHEFLRTPGYTPVIETLWSQPDIYPLDMISVESRTLGTSSIRFMVMSIKHVVAKEFPARSLIRARYIPPELAA